MEMSHFHIPPTISTVPFLQFLRWNWSSYAPYALSFPLSAFASMVKASYNCSNSCSACGHLLQDLNHFFLYCLASESLRKSIFGFAVCTLACGSAVESLRSTVASPSLGRGWLAPPLNQAASKIEILQYALQIVETNQAIVPNMKKSTLMQQLLSVNIIVVLNRKVPICINWFLLSQL